MKGVETKNSIHVLIFTPALEARDGGPLQGPLPQMRAKLDDQHGYRDMQLQGCVVTGLCYSNNTSIMC